MTEINTADWLNAVDAHPDTLDTDLLVAVAITNGETSVDGIDQDTVDDSIAELITFGFLDDVMSIDCDGCGAECHTRSGSPLDQTSSAGCVEHVLELRLPAC
jgi:hypothetical protein